MKPLLSALLLIATAATGQFIGYTSPQNVTNNNSTAPIFTVTAPYTSATATCSIAVPNIGETSHFFTYVFNKTAPAANILRFRAHIEGSNVSPTGPFAVISDYATNSVSTLPGFPQEIGGGLTATIFMPFVRVCVDYFTANILGVNSVVFSYVGTSTIDPFPWVGIFARAGGLVWQGPDTAQPANAIANLAVTPAPRGRSGGTVYFQYSAATCAASTLTVTDSSLGNIFSSSPIALFPIANTTNIQAFSIPDRAINSRLFVNFLTGCGASAATYVLAYVFNDSQNGSYPGEMMQGTTPSGGQNTNSATSTGAGNPVKIGCAYNTTPPTVTDGQLVDLQCDANGSIIPSSTSPGSTILIPSSSATAAKSNSISTASEASRVFKASPGNLYGLVVFNAGAAAQFYLCFNSTTLPANGAQTVTAPLFCPSSTSCSLDYNDIPINFSTGMTCANSSTQPTLTVGAADSTFQGLYK